jgi:hypothetical protein
VGVGALFFTTASWLAAPRALFDLIFGVVGVVSGGRG